MNTLLEKLDEMKHNTFMYNTKNYKILSYQFQNGSVLIATDKKIFTFDRVQFEKEIIKDFLPVVDDDADMVLQLVPSKKEMTNLKTVIMENIEKVREDKSYIPQAQSVNKSVNTLLNLVNTEIRVKKGLQ
jgi:hypothetical protein